MLSCVQSFKDTNRKQFTTVNEYYSFMFQLCSIFQRYKSKAIHNSQSEGTHITEAVFNLSKIQIESNSQHPVTVSSFGKSCVQSFKDTNRKQFTTGKGNGWKSYWLCSIFQRYKSKAIHNTSNFAQKIIIAVFNLSKIQIESNSQLRCNSATKSKGCVQYFKDTNREQFTTQSTILCHQILLCSIFQRYKSRAIHNRLYFRAGWL